MVCLITKAKSINRCFSRLFEGHKALLVKKLQKMEKKLNPLGQTRLSTVSVLILIVSALLSTLITNTSHSQNATQTVSVVHACKKGTHQSVKAQVQYTGSIDVESEDERSKVLPINIRSVVKFDQKSPPSLLLRLRR